MAYISYPVYKYLMYFGVTEEKTRKEKNVKERWRSQFSFSMLPLKTEYNNNKNKIRKFGASVCYGFTFHSYSLLSIIPFESKKQF